MINWLYFKDWSSTYNVSSRKGDTRRGGEVGGWGGGPDYRFNMTPHNDIKDEMGVPTSKFTSRTSTNSTSPGLSWREDYVVKHIRVQRCPVKQELRARHLVALYIGLHRRTCPTNAIVSLWAPLSDQTYLCVTGNRQDTQILSAARTIAYRWTSKLTHKRRSKSTLAHQILIAFFHPIQWRTISNVH